MGKVGEMSTLPGINVVNHAEKDLLAFHNSLPDWAQHEFRALLEKAYGGGLDGGQLVDAFQDLMNRAEHAPDFGAGAYLH